jgi:hypothetical protein
VRAWNIYLRSVVSNLFLSAAEDIINMATPEEDEGAEFWVSISGVPPSQGAPRRARKRLIDLEL